MKEVDPKALFHLSVLGPLVSRERLARGELQQLIRELAQREYAIPGSRRHLLGEKTIEAWYYAWRRNGIAGLTPKARVDRGQSRLPAELQAAIIAAKRENPRRSIRQIRRLLEAARDRSARPPVALGHSPSAAAPRPVAAVGIGQPARGEATRARRPGLCPCGYFGAS